MGRVRSAILLAALVTGGAVGVSTLDAAGAQAVRSPAAPANGNSVDAAVSADGRFVAFTSGATNLVRGDTNGLPDVFVRDRAAGTTELVSVAYDGAQADSDSHTLGISADARFVLFASAASNLTPGDTCCWKIYVRDRLAHTTLKVTPTPTSFKYNRGAISADGRFVAFTSDGPIEIGGRKVMSGLFVWDRVTGTMELLAEGVNVTLRDPAISADGRFVAFVSQASNLVPGDSNGREDVFVRDRIAGTTERVSVGPNGVEANGSSYDVAISGDGRLVAFDSVASNLAPGDTGETLDVFVRNRLAATTTRVNESDGASLGTISADGRFVAFVPRAPNGILG